MHREPNHSNTPAQSSQPQSSFHHLSLSKAYGAMTWGPGARCGSTTTTSPETQEAEEEDWLYPGFGGGASRRPRQASITKPTQCMFRLPPPSSHHSHHTHYHPFCHPPPLTIPITPHPIAILTILVPAPPQSLFFFSNITHIIIRTWQTTPTLNAPKSPPPWLCLRPALTTLSSKK